MGCGAHETYMNRVHGGASMWGRGNREHCWIRIRTEWPANCYPCHSTRITNIQLRTEKELMSSSIRLPFVLHVWHEVGARFVCNPTKANTLCKSMSVCAQHG